MALLMQHPTEKDLAGVKDFVKLCDFNIKCVNDWSVGWWVTAYGGATQYKASPPDPDYNQLTRPFLALTVNSLDCNLIERQGMLNYYKC